jgi:FHA domain-containing protein
MSVLRSLEEKIAGLVEGTFGRVFRSEVRPVELARKLAKEMDEHRTVSVSRTYVPNEYVVWLSPQDRERYEGVEQSVIDELGAYLLEHARRERLALVSKPQIEFRTDDRLALGEFGIQARLVQPAGAGGEGVQGSHEARPADMGHTMVYSTSDRHQAALEQVGSGAGVGRRRAIVVANGKRLVVPPGGALLGRSRDCDIVLDDSNVSRRHAEISPSGQGWRIQDLGSTNGVRVNGRQVEGPHPLESGDRVELGTVSITFEVE